MIAMRRGAKRASFVTLMRRYALPFGVICTLVVVAVAAPNRSALPGPSTLQHDGALPTEVADGGLPVPAQFGGAPIGDPAATPENIASSQPPADPATTDSRGPSGQGTRVGESPRTPAADGEDRSRCGRGGVWQQDVTGISPPCVPRFRGDNGGATAPGVTRTSVKVVVLRDDYGPYVEPVLQTAGVAASPEEEAGAVADFARFFEKHYEWYGRRVEWVYHRASCEMQLTAQCAVAEAKTIVARHRPFAVVAPLPNRAEFFSAMTRAGVVTVGGWHLPRARFQSERPYRYDWVPDGTQVMRGLANYWCAKLAGKTASRAGDAALQRLPRRLAVVAPADPTGRSHARELTALIQRGCGGEARGAVTYHYEGEFSESQEQFQTIVETMRSDGITTVTCLCDPVRPIFLTSAADLQGFFPEHLLSGMYATDIDPFARLYSQTQWRNAFGPVLQPPAVPREEQDDYKAYADVGASYRCFPCLATFTWMHLAAIQLQLAGPRLTPAAFERGTISGPRLRQSSDPGFPRVGFGPGRYTAMLDAYEVSWSPAAPSAGDGKPGSYVCSESPCRRYRPGRWPRGEPPRA